MQEITKEDIISVREIVNQISGILKRSLAPTEVYKIIDFTKNSNMEHDLILEAFKFSIYRKNIRNTGYVFGIMENWKEEGINTIQELEDKLGRYTPKDREYYIILSEIGLKKTFQPSDSEKQMIDAWYDEYKLTLEQILIFCKITRKKGMFQTIQCCNSLIEDIMLD